MKNPRRYPVSSFGPELLAALVTGARKEVIIPCESERQMMNLQLRLQSLRGSMGREKHAQYELVTRARTQRMWDESPDEKETRNRKEVPKRINFRLRIIPNDSQFTDILKKAGVEVDEAQIEALAPAQPDPPPQPGGATLDEIADPYAGYKS